MDENDDRPDAKLRGTGRTTRLIEYAIKEARSGKHIVIVSHGYSPLSGRAT